MYRLRAIWQQLTPLYRHLCLLFVASSVLLNLILAPLPWTRNHVTALHHTAGFFVGYTSDDSWGPMSAAYEEYRHAPMTPFYRAVFFDRRVKFIYPPSSLLTFWLLERLHLGEAGRTRVLGIVSWLAVALTAVLVTLIFRRCLRAERSPPRSDDRWNQVASVLLPV